MNCDQFEERLNQLLDQRSDVTADVPLQEHAGRCDHCQASYRLWSTFAETSCKNTDHELELAASVSQQSTPRSRLATYGLAAAVLIAAGLQFATLLTGNGQPVASVAPADGTKVRLTDPASEITPGGADASIDPEMVEQVTLSPVWVGGESWWTFVEDGVFVESTKPAFESVRVGVEPLSRSMKRAFAILMFPSSGAVDSATQEQTPVTFREQTSMEFSTTLDQMV
ncbi:hypothetical protein U8335_06345 [Roseiconus lacunae]|uniref:Zinc-finger domain-containing protein n=1 Tax=Roseiconus lacunae TaxID=2605694 RepID=A0ABT7PIC4_9BACT|nr:hypothetical protein [Roseiconus lacunae]MDM4016240.1 hypothetical protein [Roseiconus lacunae]WRQ52157.1 hypothetical protein U8335_06345 [Stieleria sp. HD01]